jgi:hypothetical protein
MLEHPSIVQFLLKDGNGSFGIFSRLQCIDRERIIKQTESIVGSVKCGDLSDEGQPKKPSDQLLTEANDHFILPC